VEVALDVERATALKAEGVARELDRVDDRPAVLDPEGDVGPVERGLGGGREPEDLEQREVGGQLAEVALGDVRLTLALEGPQVVAPAVERELAGDLAAEPLVARKVPGVALEVGAAERQLGFITRCG